MEYSISILNHWKRKNDGAALLERLQTLMPEKNIFLSYDAGDLGLWKNFKQALSHKPDGWQFLLHDDMAFSDTAFKHVDMILSNAPAVPISFFTPPNKSFDLAAQMGRHVVKSQANFWIPAAAFPPNFCPPFFEYINATVGEKCIAEDDRLQLYCDTHGLWIYTILPSLFQHAGAARSLLGNPEFIGRNERRSRQYLPDAEFESVYWEGEFFDPVIDKMRITKANPIWKHLY